MAVPAVTVPAQRDRRTRLRTAIGRSRTVTPLTSEIRSLLSEITPLQFELTNNPVSARVTGEVLP
jgi:hypothetical protein